ncbi:hypothetical protein BSM4216_2989 [Bacillus smithii]|nr:hypothetical protein BSM4216_2989 [Bacillus smithii]
MIPYQKNGRKKRMMIEKETRSLRKRPSKFRIVTIRFQLYM